MASLLASRLFSSPALHIRCFSTFRAVVVDQFLPPPPYEAKHLQVISIVHSLRSERLIHVFVQVKTLPSLKAGRDSVVLAVKAAAVNFPDILIVQGKYQVKPDLPFSPGFEVAGVVEEVGESVTTVKKGDRVIGFNTHGAFAQQILLPSNRLIPIPKGVDFAEASALLMTCGTAYYALADKGQLKSDQSVLILGASGGVGVAAIQIAKALGAKVIAAASNDEKLALCKAQGADEVVNYSTTDLKLFLKDTCPKGVDVVLDPVGGPATEAAIRNLAWNGRHLIIGFASGDIPRVPLNLPLLKGCQLVGVFWGEFTRREPARFVQQLGTLLQWLAEGRIKPHISQRFPLDQAHLALNAVAERRAVGKIVITP